MSAGDSMFLNNTKKDLIGNVTSVVPLAGFMRRNPADTVLDSHVCGFLSEALVTIRSFVECVTSVGIASGLNDEAMATIDDLVPQESGYYDRTTVNALLTLYAGPNRLEDFWEQPALQFHSLCRRLVERKLSDLVCVALWSRVDGFERGARASPLDLFAIYMAALPMIPEQQRGQMKQPLDWLTEVKANWSYSEATVRGLERTAGAPSGLTRVLAEL